MEFPSFISKKIIRNAYVWCKAWKALLALLKTFFPNSLNSSRFYVKENLSRVYEKLFSSYSNSISEIKFAFFLLVLYLKTVREVLGGKQRRISWVFFHKPFKQISIRMLNNKSSRLSNECSQNQIRKKVLSGKKVFILPSVYVSVLHLWYMAS